jgi:S-(hydroxymethyl)glutathione dehydrogenase/alcohol dehydrogenase
VRELTDGRGADYVFVTVGAKVAIEQSFGFLAPGGAVVLVGMTANGVTVDFDSTALASMNQRVLGSKMGSGRLPVDIPKLVALYQQGQLQLDELVTGRFRLDQIDEAVASVKRGEALRNVIEFG